MFVNLIIALVLLTTFLVPHARADGRAPLDLGWFDRVPGLHRTAALLRNGQERIISLIWVWF